MSHKYLLLSTIMLFISYSIVYAEEKNEHLPVGSITLKESLALTLMQNPELAAFSYNVRAKEAAVLQAGLFPNPELEIDLSEFGGTKDLSGFNGSQVSIGIRQPVLLGGKISDRIMVANMEREIGSLNYEKKRLEVLTETSKAFVNGLAAQEQLVLSQTSYDISEKIFRMVSERVKEGIVSPLELSKAKVVLKNSRIKLDRAKRELKLAKQQLSAKWGPENATITELKGSFVIVNDIPDKEDLFQLIGHSPDIVINKKETELMQARLMLEKANQYPDLSLKAGLQRYLENGEYAFTVGMSIPLPFFDRNQGSVTAAKYELEKSHKESLSSKIDIKLVLTRHYQELSSAYQESRILRDEILPAAETAFNAAKEGYKEGKFEYLDVLDAQRTLIEMKEQYINVLKIYHSSAAEINFLIGMKLQKVRRKK